MRKYGYIAMGISALIAAFICYSPQAKAGAIQGMRLCEGTIIPALLPVLILTNIIIKSRCAHIFEGLFGRLTRLLFKLPECTAPAIIFGLIGGYPAGAILTDNLYRQGLIDEATVRRIMRFNFSGGLTFIITAVGQIRYESKETGLALFLACLIPEILTGVTSGLFVEQAPTTSRVLQSDLSLNDAMVSSVEAATKNILIMCAYIILFSATCAVLPLPHSAMPLLEITNGIFKGEILAPDYAAFFLAFGGLCIHFQIMAYLHSGYFEFLIFRIINAVLSFGIMHLYLILNPIEQEVFSNQAEITARLTQANIGYGIIMIIGCAVIVFDIENRRLKLR